MSALIPLFLLNKVTFNLALLPSIFTLLKAIHSIFSGNKFINCSFNSDSVICFSTLRVSLSEIYSASNTLSATLFFFIRFSDLRLTSTSNLHFLNKSLNEYLLAYLLLEIFSIYPLSSNDLINLAIFSLLTKSPILSANVLSDKITLEISSLLWSTKYADKILLLANLSANLEISISLLPIVQ